MILRDVIVVGAGPAGLATAIAAAKNKLSCQVIEKGALVNSLLHYPTEMVFFTTPELHGDRRHAVREPVRQADAARSAALLPARLGRVQARRRRSTKRWSPSRATRRQTRRAPSWSTRSRRAGVRRSVHGRTVVIATGAYDFPNRLGVPGEDLPHVSHYYTQPHPFFRKRVVIVGGKNSAAEAALDLFRAGAQRDDRPPRRRDGRFDRVLGEAGHRQPDQGRIDRGALRHAASSRSRPTQRRGRAARADARRSTPTRSSC